MKVLVERQQQLELKVQKNREAQENSLRRREELIRELEMERELRRRETQEVENLRTARREEIDSQVRTVRSSYTSGGAEEEISQVKATEISH